MSSAWSYACITQGELASDIIHGAIVDLWLLPPRHCRMWKGRSGVMDEHDFNRLQLCDRSGAASFSFVGLRWSEEAHLRVLFTSTLRRFVSAHHQRIEFMDTVPSAAHLNVVGRVMPSSCKVYGPSSHTTKEGISKSGSPTSLLLLYLENS